MRRLVAAVFIIAAIIAIGLLMAGDPAAEADYELAEARVARAIAENELVLTLDDLHALDRLPPEIATLDKLVQLNFNTTNVSDIGPVAGLTALKHLNMRGTRVTDLSPVAGLQELLIIDLDQSWVADLSPLAGLPKLRRIGLGDTQVRSLEPLTRASSLEWINLHGAYALDGSRTHYEALAGRGVTVNNGRAFREDYQPDGLYRTRVRVGRLLGRLGLTGEG